MLRANFVNNNSYNNNNMQKLILFYLGY